MIPKPKRNRRKQEKVQKVQLFENERKRCFKCQTIFGLERHHIMFGTGNRQKSEKYGLVVWLCAKHHRGNDGVHFNRNFDLQLKEYAQYKFEEMYGHEKWMQEFGRNYL